MITGGVLLAVGYHHLGKKADADERAFVEQRERARERKRKAETNLVSPESIEVAPSERALALVDRATDESASFIESQQPRQDRVSRSAIHDEHGYPTNEERHSRVFALRSELEHLLRQVRVIPIACPPIASRRVGAWRRTSTTIAPLGWFLQVDLCRVAEGSPCGRR